jgi:hypothetical protein
VRKWPHLQQWCVRNEPLQKGIDKAWIHPPFL